jgi:alpha-1,2-mannosyltransferase
MPSAARSLPRAAWIAALVVAVSIIYIVKIAHRMPDFEVYQRAGIRARGAEPLYRPDDGHYQFKYLPAFAVAVAPIAALPDAAARATWFGCSVALLALLLRLSLAIVPDRRHRGAVLVATTFVLLGKFYAHELELGQVNILMAALIVAATRQMRVGSEGSAGFLVAAAVVVKPYAVLFLPYLVARRRVTSLTTAAAGLVSALLLPAVVYGFAGNLRLLQGWWTTVSESTAPNLMDANNVSAASVFARALGPGLPAQILALLMVLVLLTAAAFVFSRRRALAFPEGLEIALLLTMVPIISPQGWDYVFLVSTPGVMYLVNYRDALPGSLRTGVIVALLVIAFSIFDLMGRPAYYMFMSLSIIPAAYLVVLAGLVMLRVRRAC